MGIRCLVPFLRKLRSVYGPRDSRYSSVTNSLLGGNRRDSERIETTVTPTADGCVNNIKFASYLTGNRPLTCKRITKRQRPSNTRTIFHVIH